MEGERSQRDRKIKHRQVWRSGNVSHLIYYLSEQFPDAFMVSSCFKYTDMKLDYSKMPRLQPRPPVSVQMCHNVQYDS